MIPGMMLTQNQFSSLSRRFLTVSCRRLCSSTTISHRTQGHHRHLLLTRSLTTKTGQDHHAFFQEQLEELEKERKSFFAEDEAITTSSDPATQTGQEHHALLFEEQLQELESERTSGFGSSSTQQETGPAEAEMEFIHEEREAIFQFSEQEKQAWSSSPKQTLSPQLLQEIAQAREQQDMPKEQQQQQQQPQATTSSTDDNEHHSSFSHVTQDGASIHMVDVGHKAVTTRMAQAQTKVLLPDEVLEAFACTTEELIGPKGPIFATAKLAGIMAAKKTSDLIPLCHPLPLDQVKIDIRLQGKEVIIDCTCRVTHKTGVEMEALTGATVAALTVYDMVKAVSHQVRITDTRLIAKTGGKRTVSNKP